jgi:hypothetical protein
LYIGLMKLLFSYWYCLLFNAKIFYWVSVRKIHLWDLWFMLGLHQNDWTIIVQHQNDWTTHSICLAVFFGQFSF